MLIPPLSEAGGRGCPATAACCGTMRYIGRALSAVDVGGGRGKGSPRWGDALMTERIQNRGWQESDTWCRVSGGRG